MNGQALPGVHHREDETISVLSGEITFFLGDKTILMKKGDYIFAPRGIPHHFKNTGTEEAILLETASPAGIEVFFEAVGHPLPDREAQPPPPTAEDIAHMIATAPSFGIDIFVALIVQTIKTEKERTMRSSECSKAASLTADVAIQDNANRIQSVCSPRPSSRIRFRPTRDAPNRRYA